MSRGNPEFEREIKALITALEDGRGKVQDRLQLAQREIDAIETTVGSLQASLEFYRLYHGLPKTQGEVDQRLQEKFADLSTKNALIRLALANENLLVGRDACKTLVRAGIFTSYRNASGSVYSTLKRYSNLFEKVGRGRYKLVTQAVGVTARMPWESQGAQEAPKNGETPTDAEFLLRSSRQSTELPPG